MKSQITIAIRFVLIMTILTGLLYTFFMTAIAQLFFPDKANGSLVMKDDKTVGSALIGQKFDSSIYFWTRPSAIGYNPVPSGASNFGPTSETLKKQVTARRTYFIKMNSLPDTITVPGEMIFASGSGLDPHISPAAALLQVDRIVKARGFNGKQRAIVLDLIGNYTEDPQFHILGEERINVFLLNLSLDTIK